MPFRLLLLRVLPLPLPSLRQSLHRRIPQSVLIASPSSSSSTSSPAYARSRVPLPRFSSSSSSSSPANPMASLSTPPAPPAGKFEWLVVIPDKPGVHEKRLEVRAQHLAGSKPLAESGFVKTGGAIFNEKPESDDASKFSFYGSTLVCVASSKEEILELLEKDIYTTSGVWDLEKVQIWPAKFAFRNP